MLPSSNCIPTDDEYEVRRQLSQATNKLAAYVACHDSRRVFLARRAATLVVKGVRNPALRGATMALWVEMVAAIGDVWTGSFLLREGFSLSSQSDYYFGDE